MLNEVSVIIMTDSLLQSHVLVYLHVKLCTCTYTHMCTHTYTHTPTHTHTHTHTHAVVVQFLETGCGTEDSMTSLQSEKCPQETVRAVFAGIRTLLDAALRQPSLKLEVASYM